MERNTREIQSLKEQHAKELEVLRKQSELHAKRLAHYDTLTSLPNRRLLMERLSLAVRRAQLEQRSVGWQGTLQLLQIERLHRSLAAQCELKITGRACRRCFQLGQLGL